MKIIIVAVLLMVALSFAVQEAFAQTYEGWWDVKCSGKIANPDTGEIYPFSMSVQVYMDDQSQPGSDDVYIEYYDDNNRVFGVIEGNKNAAYFNYSYDGFLYSASATGYVKVNPKSMKAKIFVILDPSDMGFGTCTVKKSRS